MEEVMKFLKQILFMTLLTIGFSMTAMAQRDNNQNRPPKNDPPVINPSDKDRPKDPPKNDNNNGTRPKKPRDEYQES